MLSSYSAQIIAFIGDGFIVCRDCALKRSNAIAIEKAERGLSNSSGLSPLCRYSCESEWWEDGLYCGDCHTELVEAHPRYVVVENTPGYLPESEPAEFDNYADAVAYADELADELEEQGYDTDRSVASRDNYYAIQATREQEEAESGFYKHHPDSLGRVIEVIRSDN